MSKPKALTPNAHLHVTIQPDLKDRLDIWLFSEVENRIPKGAHKDFIEQLIREFFEYKQAPLEAYGFPAGYFVTGPTAMVEAVVKRLKGESSGNT